MADIIKKIKTIIQTVTVTLLLATGICLLYNFFALFFPISTQLEADGAEHLHAVYLLSIGQKPYLDFIQNHPMLFHHLLAWVEKHFQIDSIRHLAMVGRIVIFGHFMLCLAVFCLWTSRVLKNRPKTIAWAAMLTAAWAMLDIYNTDYYLAWNLRPDFICYGQTLLGLYLIYLWIARPSEAKNRWAFILAMVGGCLVGFGNSVLPKGIPFIAAFALTILAQCLISSRAAFLSRLSRKHLKELSIIGMAIILSFLAGMILDCRLSNVPVRSWIHAVFLLNSKKHIIFTNIDNSPVTHIIGFFSFSLPLAFALIVWIIWELATFNRSDCFQNGQSSVWLFSIFTILVNITLPTYSNGVTWSYYYIPCLFAAAAICLLLLLRFRDFYNSQLFEGPLSIPGAGAIILGFLIGIQILNTPIQSSLELTSRRASAREVANTNLPDFVNDEILPKHFVYLGYPNQMPIKARNWGYYFMLARSTHFWKDCYSLGLGPDPQESWGKGFGGNPPDAITFTTPGEVSDLMFMVRNCQNIDISWLPDKIRERYVLMKRPRASLYIRKDHVADLESQGWHEVTR